MSFPIKAYCYVTPQGKPCHGGAEAEVPCSGMVFLTQEDADTCKIKYEVGGLSPGEHGFHIHEKADFSNGCVSAGGHYNPHGKTHGGPNDSERHAGDLGNIVPDANGLAVGEFADPLVKLFGEHSVIGRSFMVHADADDLGQGGHEDSKTTGHAGARIACGEIKLFPIIAECTVSPEGKPCGNKEEAGTPVTGMVRLEQVDADTCEISYEVSGLTPGDHGFHIHEKADFSNGCTSAGPHFNPFKRVHGGPTDTERHVGDLGNITPDASGVARGTLRDALVKLYGPHTVLGRSFMVHADADDLGRGGHELSATTGNAGARVSCGEIKASQSNL